MGAAEAAMNRALPGRIHDLVHDGVDSHDLKQRGDRAVWAALLSTAASAQQRGWSETDWVGYLDDPRHRLYTQASIRGRRVLSARDVRETLARAWRSASAWLAAQPPPPTPDEIRHVAWQVAAACADATCDLSDAERAVLAHAACIAADNSTITPALARRATMAATGLSDKAVRAAHRSLDERGLLTIAVRGRASATEGKRRATTYRLPTTEKLSALTYPENGSMGPGVQVYGTWPGDLPGQIYGTDRPGSDQEETVVTITLTGSPAAVTEALQRLAAHELTVERTEAPSEHSDAAVIDLNRRREVS